MRIDVLTIFPELIDGFTRHALLGKAMATGRVAVRTIDPREHATGNHRSVDDAPYGGGAGMVMRPEPIFAAAEAAQVQRPLFLLGAGGRVMDQELVADLAGSDGFSLLCGRYEGVDQRVRDHLCEGEIGVGDVVLAGGEAAALVLIDAVVRLVDGVMGNVASAEDESFSDGLLEYPQYTRPASFRGWEVPGVLRSGDHGAVERWRRAAALRRTIEARPDLIEARGGLTDEEHLLLDWFTEISARSD